MFVDEVIIKVVGGAGGDGCTAFRREKYVPLGGPAGGNGGSGSNIIFKVDEGLKTLLDLQYQKTIVGKKGENGQGKGMHGKKAEDLIVKVPAGIVITDTETNQVIADLTKKGEEFIVAQGGRGGRGNIAFSTQSNPASTVSEHGEPGQERRIKIELKLLADVGFVGMPSVGKSTILSIISKSKPKIGAYHFTTLSPNLGVAKTKDNRSFVVADLPGLIEGASLGEGLGDQFLRHIERTRVIAHVIDMSAYEGRDPYEDYQTINKELENFNPNLMKKKQIIIANKMDMPEAATNLETFKTKVTDVDIFPVSAVRNEGLDAVLLKLADILDETPVEPLVTVEPDEEHVVYKYTPKEPFFITNEDGVWIITGREIEKLFKMTKFNSEEAYIRFSKILKTMGVDAKLKELGAKEDDPVRIEDFEFEYKDY